MAEQIRNAAPGAAKRLSRSHLDWGAIRALPMRRSELLHVTHQLRIAHSGGNRNGAAGEHLSIGNSQARAEQHSAAIVASLQGVRGRHEEPLVAGIVAFEASRRVFLTLPAPAAFRRRFAEPGWVYPAWPDAARGSAAPGRREMRIRMTFAGRNPVLAR